jgi:molecular chaperone GrpE
VAGKEENANRISELESQSGDGPVPDSGEQAAKGEQDKLAGIKQALAAKTDEAQGLQEKYLRLAAEFDNFKKLAQKEQREFSRFANENILKELLPIIDNLERAIQSAKEQKENRSSNGLIQGVELTLKQFLEALTKFGVQPIASVGEPFDPTHHQAVARVESAMLPENSVVEEYQKGYRLHDRILRAAMVTVSAGPAGSPGGGSAAAKREERTSSRP